MTTRCVFRVCAGPRLGFGHLMRARALAHALPWPAVFSLRGGATARAAARRLGLTLLESRDSLRPSDVVVVDDVSGEHARQWIERARCAGARTVAVNDVPRHLAADVVVCGSIDNAADDLGEARTLTGASFYLLDPRIAASKVTRASRRAAAPAGRRAPRVLVALGGGVHVRKVARTVAGAVADCCPGAAITVAAGFTTGRTPVLDRARWLPAGSSFLTALADADAAIVAGGVTLYETMALGVPAVGLAVVPEQRPAIRAFAARRALIDACGTSASPKAIATAAASVARLLDEPSLRRQMRREARRLVDGRGVYRVAAHIASISPEIRSGADA